MTTKQRPWRDRIGVHPAANAYPLMGAAELAELAADIKAHNLDQRVLLWRDDDGLIVIDGRNRLDALTLLDAPLFDDDGAPNPTYFAFDPRIPGVSAQNRVATLNLHRRHLTSEQKRLVIAMMLLNTPEKSDRSIAREARVDKNTVAAKREKMVASGTIAPVAKTIGRDGKARPARRARKVKTEAEIAAKKDNEARLVKVRALAASPALPCVCCGEKVPPDRHSGDGTDYRIRYDGEKKLGALCDDCVALHNYFTLDEHKLRAVKARKFAKDHPLELSYQPWPNREADLADMAAQEAEEARAKAKAA